jgi:hypothetical protein
MYLQNQIRYGISNSVNQWRIMMLYELVSLHRFQKLLPEFSYKASEVLYDYYDSLEEFTHFEPVGIKCEWSEYDYDDFFTENKEYMNVMPDSPVKEQVLRYLTKHGANPIDLGNSVLFQNY